MAAKPSALATLAAAPPSNRGGRPLAADSYPDDVRAAMVAARQAGASFAQIADALAADGYPLCSGAVRNWLHRQGVR